MDNKFSSVKIFFILVILLVLVGIVSALERDQAPKTVSPSLENSLRSNILDTETQSSSPAPDFSYATTTIATPNGNIVVQIADTLDKQTQGLSDRTSLSQGSGMLFVFSAAAPQYMWMKDMNFSLDMVWLDQNKKVTYIATDVTPETYKTNPPEIFSSPTPALYVIELPNGDASRLNIALGSLLSFETGR